MKIIETKYSKNNPGHYSPGFISNDNLYISGQLSIDPATGIKPPDFRSEVLQALDNIEAVLKAAELTRKHVVMCRVYISDVELWPEFNEIYAGWFGSHKPARAIVPVAALHYGCQVEIEAIAEFCD